MLGAGWRSCIQRCRRGVAGRTMRGTRKRSGEEVEPLSRRYERRPLSWSNDGGGLAHPLAYCLLERHQHLRLEPHLRRGGGSRASHTSPTPAGQCRAAFGCSLGRAEQGREQRCLEGGCDGAPRGRIGEHPPQPVDGRLPSSRVRARREALHQRHTARGGAPPRLGERGERLGCHSHSLAPQPQRGRRLELLRRSKLHEATHLSSRVSTSPGHSPLAALDLPSVDEATVRRRRDDGEETLRRR